MNKEAEWYSIRDTDKLDTPTLVIYKQRVVGNIKNAVHIAGDAGKLRPHVKTHKSPDVARLCMQEGISKFKCATIAEAEMLAMVQAPDVLLAYQPTRQKLGRFLQLIQNYPATQFSCLADNEETILMLNQEAGMLKEKLSVFIDINTGMNRTGIVPGKKALALYSVIYDLPFLKAKGFHAYDGHIHAPDREKRKKLFLQAHEQLWKLLQEAEALSGEKPLLVAGGSTTFSLFAAHDVDAEYSPGTFVFWDSGYLEELPDEPFLPAALVLSRVVSTATDGRITIDLGHKSIASENALGKRASILNHPELTAMGHSEEHMVLLQSKAELKTGDLLYVLPFHICPTIALYDTALVVENHEIIDEWKIIARNRKINY